MRPTFAVVSASSRPILHGGDRARSGRDRVVARLGADARVRRLAPEARLDRVVGRGGEHDLANGRGVVEDKAEVGAQARLVERLGALQSLLLAGGEQDLDTGRGLALTHDPAHGAHDRRDRGLVVGAEDRLVAVREQAVLAHHLHRAVERHGVHVRAEEDRRSALRAPRSARQQVAGRVLLHLEPEPAQILGQGVRRSRARCPDGLSISQ